MTIAFDSRVRSSANVLVRELEGEAVLLNLDTESYYGLDEVGARMWSVVNASDSVQSAYDTLIVEYDVDAERLREDLLRMIQEWIDHGLAQIDEG